MINWIPGVKMENYDEWAFKKIFWMAKEMVGFIGMIQLILTFFFLIDMIMSWKHPLKYISNQKKMIPRFLISAKVLQVCIFTVASNYGKTGFFWAFVPIAVAQLMLTFCFFIVECARKRK
jgi:cadmium resistance protein CadD (predicted permease)